jgi:hypothetical protein
MTCGREAPPTSDEEQAEQAVLALLLDVHPAQLSLDELVRELTDHPDDFAPATASTTRCATWPRQASCIATEPSCSPAARRCASKS